MASRERTPLGLTGFGHDVTVAMEERRQALVDMGLAVRQPDGSVQAPRDILDRLRRQELERVGQELAAQKGLPFQPSQPGEYVTGKLSGSVQLASGRFAMLENGLGFQLVPWQPLLDHNLGRYLGGRMRGDGGIEWDLGRQRGLGL